MDDEYISKLEKELENVSLSKEDKGKVVEAFLVVDENRNGQIEASELKRLFQAAGKSPAGFEIRNLISKYTQDNNGTLSPTEVAEVYRQLCSDTVAEKFQEAVTKKKGIVTKSGTSTVEGTQHSYSPEEMVAFCNWINQNLKNDPDLKNMPIDAEDEDKFFEALSDGIILCKMINLSQKGTIDERAINKKKSPNKAAQIHRDQENLNLALNSASAIGCSIVNIGAQDIKNKRAHLILGLLWQVIRIGLFAAFNLERTPDLGVLLEDGETLEDLMNLSPELLLLRWMNYHLKKSPKYQASASGGKQITNFSGDIKDSYAYLCLLEQIQPQPEDEGYAGDMINVDCDKFRGSSKDVLEKRAKYMLNEADKIGCRAFVTEHDVVRGHANLNMAFVANLFNTYPALKDDEDREKIVETREEKTYRNWMNSLGASPRVNRIYNDLRDGLVFHQLFQIVRPGIGKKPNQPPFNKMGGFMKKRENCDQVVNMGRDLKYSLVGIGGDNICEGQMIATLSVSWQLMRGYTLGILEKLGESGASDEKAIIEWVNHKLESSGKSTGINSFKDPSIGNSHAVIDLVDAVGGPNTIDYSNVKDGTSEEDAESNARYAISMARKIGARVYALPEDLWEVNQKMVMTIFACIMARAMQMQ